MENRAKIIEQDIKTYYKKAYPSKRGMRMYLKGKYLSIKSVDYMKELTIRDIDSLIDKFYSTWIGDVYKEIPTIKRFSKFRETEVDRMHQMDLMTMPSNNQSSDGTEKGVGISYTLSYIDVASRRAAAVKIDDKRPSTIVAALKQIYYVGDMSLNLYGRPRFQNVKDKMHMPKILQTDGGGEFCNALVDKYLSDNNIRHIVATTSNQQAIVERFNQTLAKPLFRYMDQMEEESGKKAFRFTDWEPILKDVMQAYNSSHHTGIRTSPDTVYFQRPLKHVESEVYVDVDILPIGTSVRIPRNSMNMKKRATDSVWSPEVYMISGSVKKSVSDPMKYKIMSEDWDDVIETSYYREELLPVSDTTTLQGYDLGPSVVRVDEEDDKHAKVKPIDDINDEDYVDPKIGSKSVSARTRSARRKK